MIKVQGDKCIYTGTMGTLVDDIVTFIETLSEDRSFYTDVMDTKQVFIDKVVKRLDIVNPLIKEIE